MSKWYKKAQMGNDLTFVVYQWLKNAKNHPEMANANDDVSFQMGGADNQESLSAAIASASSRIAGEQGGQLTPSQQELIQNLQNRTQGAIQNDPMAIPEVGQNNQFQQNDSMGMEEPGLPSN